MLECYKRLKKAPKSQEDPRRFKKAQEISRRLTRLKKKKVQEGSRRFKKISRRFKNKKVLECYTRLKKCQEGLRRLKKDKEG